MRSTLHPSLVNGRSGDPALFVDTLHQRSALLFDFGDLSALGAGDLLRVSHAFVTHMPIDRFIGFDTLLRTLVGRDKTVRLVGPEGFADRLYHKLQSYEWHLANLCAADLVFDVLEVEREGWARSARFRFQRKFSLEDEREFSIEDGLILVEPEREVRAAILDHHGPSLAFAVQERAHVRIWKKRLDARGLPMGTWLQTLKKAIMLGAQDDCPVPTPKGLLPLAELRDLATVTDGQTLVYVAGAADTQANRDAIVRLARGADMAFIAAPFAAGDADQARRSEHLTTRAAGEIARAAGVRRIEPFHFSPHHAGEEHMMAEVRKAFEAA
ncbi:hypothetical protein IC614_06515 [Allosphingosinicella flava]|uniref:Uncharacterized protein n=1 Tax=Allosphingosinicella flava TaxID=2771430 RepID=A0A7T2GHK6_9SPHN|nr:hypothetical protein [Sphingosinicella flava]QPQ54030.1 hypothetical protein IC614_06515 [Sphingosinicella flava]